MLNEKEYALLQKTELEILCDFDAFCRERGLQYYLIGGALLGAARYGGFIPWDDDVDVAMPREDYERLQQIWDNDPSGKYFLQSGKTDPKFSRCILKLRKNNTEIVEKGPQGLDMHHGIYIDIFPVDYLSAAPDGRTSRPEVSLRAQTDVPASHQKRVYPGTACSRQKVLDVVAETGEQPLDRSSYRRVMYQRKLRGP